LNSLSFDETGSLVLKYELSGDYATDYDIDEYLIEAGFKTNSRNPSEIFYVYPKTSDKVKLSKTANFVIKEFERKFGKGNLKVDRGIENTVTDLEYEKNLYQTAIRKGLEIKDRKNYDLPIPSNFKRQLMDFQKESVAHLLAVNNGANFSVPGSGKTTITYAVISYWLQKGIIEKIMVIGPTASFTPWEEEYQACFGKPPRSIRIKGDIAGYLERVGDSTDLFLLHYQTSNSKRLELMNFLSHYKTVLVVDESHNIKSPELKKWASAALFLAPFAKRRVILSGTPMPNNAKDLWTQITFLWPHDFPFGNDRTFMDYVDHRGLGQHHRQTLNALFARIKKDDLGLPKPNFKEIPVTLSKHQRHIYDVIAAKTLEDIESLEEHSKLHKFRIAKMIRLLQTASNPSLLYEMAHEFDVDSPLFESPKAMVSSELGFEVDSIDISDLVKLSTHESITRYSELEIPRKIVEASTIARKLVDKGEKVIIWSSFLLNMDVFNEGPLKDLNPILISGKVSRDHEDHPNRDELVNQFKNDPDSKILIATAASLGESVSLHRNLKGEQVCTNAIYLDRNFNGAQFMQSVDRIHRIGMDPNATVNYYLIIGKDTIDEQINQRLLEKWQDMTNALNDPFLQDIEFDVQDESPDEFEKDYQSLVQHLRELKRKQNAN